MSFPIRNEVDGEYVLQMDPCRSKLGFVMKYKKAQLSQMGKISVKTCFKMNLIESGQSDSMNRSTTNFPVPDTTYMLSL